MSEKGQDLYRSKGILAILGTDEKYVFQAIHMIINIGSSSEFGMNHKPWEENEKRINKLCFIEKNLDKEQMIADLKKCIFDGKIPEPGPIPILKLTYNVGERVECKPDTWEKGVITQLWYREELWETGRYVPYQVQLDSDKLIWVPRDSNIFIRKANIKHKNNNKTK